MIGVTLTRWEYLAPATAHSFSGGSRIVGLQVHGVGSPTGASHRDAERRPRVKGCKCSGHAVPERGTLKQYMRNEPS